MDRLTLFLLVLMAFHPSVRADDRLRKAEKLFNELEYDQAINLADKVLQSPDAGPDELIQAYRIKGLSLSGKEQLEDAYLVFRELVAISPSYRISSDVSARLAAPFYQAAATSAEHGHIELLHQAPTGLKSLSGQKLVCSLKVNPFGMVHTIRLRYRTPAQQMTVDIKRALEKKIVVTFNMPKNLTGGVVLYHFEALNSYGGVLSRSGSGARPHRLQTTSMPVVEAPAEETTPVPVVEAPAEEPPAAEIAALSVDPIDPDATTAAPVDSSTAWYKTWWFWTVVGVAVAGATAGTVIGVTMSGGSDGINYHVQPPHRP